ncbi:MAG TPA: hypothetical protein VMJ12_18485, partial [Candidatus Acidoferrales bacterium]|nr:hypothetical protein [Candidatus Acidoferrales bacterium]
KTGQGIWAADMFKGGGGGFGGHGAGGDWGASAADNSDPTGAQAMLRQEQAQRWQTTLSRIAEIYRQMYDAGARGETKVNDLIARGGELRLQVALNPLMTSVQYQQTLVELAQNELDIKTAKAAADQETLELNRRLRDLYREQAGIEREARAHAAEGTWLTLEQLAGSRYTRSIEQQYGAGGRYDLSRGNTRFAREARELYRLTHGATAYDREYGTQSNVDWDIARIGTLRKSLSSGNVLPPDESLAAIVQHSQTTASAITDVRDQMRRDGIPVKIDSN